MEKFTAFVLQQRVKIIIVTVLLTLFFSFQLTKIKINSDILSYLPKEDPVAALFNKVGKEFGGNYLGLIAIESDNVFSKETIEHIHGLTENFKNIDAISSVTSITDVIDIKKMSEADGGGIEIGKLIDLNSLPTTHEQLQALRTYTLSKDFYNGRLVSADGKVCLIICRVKDDADKEQAVKALKEVVSNAHLSEKVYFGGMPFQLSEIGELILKDLKLLIPIVSLLVLLTLFASFGHLRGTIIPLLSVGISTVWTLGMMGFTGVPLSVISDIIPVILIAVGSASSIHIISKYDENLNRYGNTGEDTRAALSEVSTRVILAALTIIFGFTSFVFGSYLTMIREFGIFTALGVFFSLLISVMFVPSVLSILSVKKKPAQEPNNTNKRNIIKTIMDSIGDFVLKNERMVIGSALILIVLAAIGLPKIVRKVDMMDYFKPTTEIRKTEVMMQKNFGGDMPIQILVHGDMQNPFVLQEMQRLEQYLLSMEQVHNPQSIADLITEMNNNIVGTKTIPDARDKVTNLWFLLDGQSILTQLINGDKTEGLIQATISSMDSKIMNDVVAATLNYMANVDTNLVVVSLKDLPDEAKKRIYAYRINRAASVIDWSAKHRRINILQSQSSVASLLSGVVASSNFPSDTTGEMAVSILAAQLADGKNANYDKFKEDVRNVIASLHDNSVAIPESEYNKLGLPSNSAIYEVSFGMSLTGIPLIYQRLDKSLMSSQLESFIYALILIFILLAIQLRSPLGGLVGVVPIVFTVLIAFGVMGFAKIPLDIATVLVGGIALGIGIDYSIHFVVRFKTFIQESSTPREALFKTLETTGRAIVANVLTVTMGFLTLFLAQIVPLQRFGFLVSLTMIVSGIGALTVLPALILVVKPKFASKIIANEPNSIKIK